MKNNDDESLQSVSGLSFRDLAEALDEKESSESYLPFFSSNESEIKSKFQLFLYKIFKRMQYSSSTSASLFLLDLIVYMAERTRVIFVLFGVAAEVSSVYTDRLKRFLIRNMFWGRGGLFRLFVQFASVFVMITLLFSMAYRAEPIRAQYDFSNAEKNTKGDVIALKGSTTTQKPSDRPREGSTTYIVKVGDTIGGIAQLHGLNQDTILWANNLTEGSFIRPGQELSIPPGNGVLVTVKSGDTFSSLARTYNSTEQAILDNNAYALLLTESVLEVGTRLFIPDGKPPAPVVPATPIYSGVVASRPTVQSSVPSGSRFLGWPVAGGAGRVIGAFTGSYLPLHNGVDIGAVAGMPNLVAAAGGTVSYAGCFTGNSGGICYPQGSGRAFGNYNLGWTVRIDHGNGYETVYAHMDTITVRRGETVSAGQVIGRMGQSGRAYGIHVHFMLVRAGTWAAYNPLAFMR